MAAIEMFYDDDADLSVIGGRKVGVIGPSMKHGNLKHGKHVQFGVRRRKDHAL